jgi:hypothetical protein
MRFTQTNSNRGNVNNAIATEADVVQTVRPGHRDRAIRSEIVGQGNQPRNRIPLWVGITGWWLGMALLWLIVVLRRTE